MPCNAQGECSFNLFGIKAGSQWSGATVNVPTLEFEAGIPVRKVERFRAYDSPADSFRDYAALIRDSSRYASARGAGDNVEAFAAALQQGGYATDPHYAQKIAAVADEVRARVRRAQVRRGRAVNYEQGTERWLIFSRPACPACSLSSVRSIRPATTSPTSAPTATAASAS